MKRLVKSILTTAFIFSSSLAKEVPLGLPPVPVPADNPIIPEKVELGKKLFEDRRFSANGTISCSHCHQKEKVFTDELPVSIGINGLKGKDNS